MSVFKCKMCGAALDVGANQTVAECEYCGTKQTLPKLTDDRRANLYDRANHFRRNNDFDKAATIYESILNDDPFDAEAYWSLVLCNYGIEYVEDPATHKRVPTVNRAQFTSVFDDENYKSALQYADGAQKSLYEAEANAINEIQKGILAISQKESPFDIFICYKETDNNGRRTQDSVLANDLYYQLTNEGFKVFFSRITLEDKLGSAYEPYIFAALNSAKVMVVLGTKPEYFNAVWVKNEWSRYLTLVKNSGGKKVLIPAYRDMDPYDLPEEFSHLQAQDMSKLGFMQDLIRGVKKLISVEVPKAQTAQTVTSAPNTNISPLLKRAFMFLEDSEWQKADDFCEQVLNQDPENAQAYLGKLMAELHCKTPGELKNESVPFDYNNNYKKTLRYGDDALKKTLIDAIRHINNRNEITHLTAVYNDILEDMNSATTEAEYKKVAHAFREISNFKDAAARMMDCEVKAAECKNKEEQKRLERKKQKIQYRKLATIIISSIAVCVVLAVALNSVIIPYAKSHSRKYMNLKIGSTLVFGTYEQDNDASNGKEELEWIVLDKKDGKVLLISKYALISRPYNKISANNTWEECSMRAWLNGTFMNDAFTAEEQKKIFTTSVSADNNPIFDTNPGKSTKDKLFLLSVVEAEKYFIDDAARMAVPTKYAKAHGVYVSSDYTTESGEASCRWWLRSPGLNQYDAAGVDCDGMLNPIGGSVELDYIAVRPAMWVTLE